MQRYLEQLYKDIENVLEKLKKDSLNCSFEDMDYNDSNSITTSTSERLRLCQLTGLSKQIFPTTNQLSLVQKSNLGQKLEELLWCCNFIIVVPLCFSHAERYSFIREIWNKPFKMNKGGLYIAELYSWNIID